LNRIPFDVQTHPRKLSCFCILIFARMMLAFLRCQLPVCALWMLGYSASKQTRKTNDFVFELMTPKSEKAVLMNGSLKPVAARTEGAAGALG
jgi:hypothetical protein